MTSQHWPSAVAYFFAAFGILAAPEVFFAGFFLALACGYGMFILRPEKGPGETWVMLIVTTLASLMLAIAHPQSEFLSSFPLQFCMGITGVLARPVAQFLTNVMSRMVAQSDEVTDAAIDKFLGDGGKKDD